MSKIQQVKTRFGIIGNSKLLNRSIEISLQVAPTDISVFITGESGTGKESIPKIIHANSKRKHNSYIAVNCGAIPEHLVGSELFGHENGSLHAGCEKKLGHVMQCTDGTLLLNDVEELPLHSQSSLARFIEQKEFYNNSEI